MALNPGDGTGAGSRSGVCCHNMRPAERLTKKQAMKILLCSDFHERLIWKVPAAGLTDPLLAARPRAGASLLSSPALPSAGSLATSGVLSFVPRSHEKRKKDIRIVEKNGSVRRNVGYGVRERGETEGGRGEKSVKGDKERHEASKNSVNSVNSVKTHHW